MPVAEKLGLDMRLGNGGAVQLHENAVAAQALGVNGARNQFLARSRFAVDEHAAVGRRHQPDLLPQRLHRHALAGQHRADAELALELQVLRAQPPRLHGVLHHDQRAVQRERLLQKVVSAQLGGLHRGFNGAVAADDHHFRPRFRRQPCESPASTSSPSRSGSQMSSKHHVVGRVLEQDHRLGRGSAPATPYPSSRRISSRDDANLRLVIHHQNVIHERISLAVQMGRSPCSVSGACPGGWFHQRNAHQEARALGAVALRAHAAAMLLHNLGRDGKPQSGAPMLGGVEGQEQPLANLVGQSVAGVGDRHLHRRAILAERACEISEHAQQAALHGLGGVIDQVGQRAANGFRIGQHRRQPGCQIAA